MPVGIPYTLEELEVIVKMTPENFVEIFKEYREKFPDSKRTNYALFDAMQHRKRKLLQYKRQLESLKQDQIKRSPVRKETLLDNSDVGEIITKSHNEVLVIEKLLREILVVNIKTYELFSKLKEKKYE